MECNSRDLSGAESTSGGGDDEKDKDITSSHRINESEEEELPDSESVETISVPQTSPQGAKDSERNRKETGRFFIDCSYLNGLSRQERLRIDGEMIKGHKLGECKSVTHY